MKSQDRVSVVRRAQAGARHGCADLAAIATGASWRSSRGIGYSRFTGISLFGQLIVQGRNITDGLTPRLSYRLP
jgi:hypothetical protein